MNNHKSFNVNQDAVLRNSKDEVLILKRTGGKWMLPGGRLENDESPKSGLLREIKEETGINECEVRGVLNVGLSESKNTFLVTFSCYTEEEKIVLSSEHEEYKWVKVKDIDKHEFSFEEIKEIIKT
ncbi:MAG: NUDIX hydrolase [Bacteroidetes bacterium]|nr:MAG: NUDIX hydrolase [Bacteroidota bacterium]